MSRVEGLVEARKAGKEDCVVRGGGQPGQGETSDQTDQDHQAHVAWPPYLGAVTATGTGPPVCDVCLSIGSRSETPQSECSPGPRWYVCDILQLSHKTRAC